MCVGVHDQPAKRAASFAGAECATGCDCQTGSLGAKDVVDRRFSELLAVFGSKES